MVDFSMRPMKEALVSLIGDKDDAAALAYLDELIGVNRAVEPANAEQETRLSEQRQLFESARDFIREHPGEWYALLSADPAPAAGEPRTAGETPRDHTRETTVLYVGFEGEVSKKVTDSAGDTQVHTRDTQGEFLPVDRADKQSHDTEILLDLVAEGNLDAIEEMGYRIKRAGEEKGAGENEDAGDAS